MEKTGAGTLTLALSQAYTGATKVAEGTLVLLGNITSPTSIEPGATLQGIGTITGLVTNAGTIAPGTPNDIGTLTIQGNYIGNGGILQTQVGGTPVAPVASVLRISGAGNTASGSTGITAIDRGGLGAPTTGDGILVVQAADGATTGATAFALADRVAGGAYEYHLVRGASAGNQQNWYLTTYQEPPVPPDPEPVPPDPDFRVETSNYPALPALQRLYTYALVDTLEQRRGALGTLAARGSADESALWGRAGGSFGETYGSGADGIDMSYDLGFLQAGVDAVTASDGHGGRVDAGVFLGVGTSTTDTSTPADGNTGDATFNAYSVGLYGTWLATSGFYADTLLQATRFSDAAAHSSDNASITTGGWSQSLSLEAGYRVGLGDSASLSPQGQIIAENFTLDGTSDEFGDVSFDNGFAARGRLGLELASNLDGFGTRTDLTLRANVWHVFADNPQTTFSSLEGSEAVSFDANFGTTWLALDAGITTAVADNASLFANAGYEYGFDDSRQAGTGRLGFTYNW
jgi:fibronectin-binding autotransporter adhesin